MLWLWVLGGQKEHSDWGMEGRGAQGAFWGGDTGIVSLQIQKQDNKSKSLLCEVVYTIHGPSPQASSKVSQFLKAEFLSLGTTDILGWIILCCGGLSCAL